MATMMMPTPDGARADDDMITGNDAVEQESGAPQPLAAPLVLVGLVGLATAGWLLRERVALIADARTLALIGVAAAALAALVGGLVLAIATSRVSRPGATLVRAAEAVAAGDFSIVVPLGSGRGDVGRLSRAVARMLVSLRHLTGTVREAATRVEHSAAAITGGGEHLASTAQHIAQTSNDLSRRAGDMNATIDALVEDAGRLVDISSELTQGAHAGVARNTQLRRLAQESGARLVEGADSLDALVTDAHSSAEAVEALASASEEIRAFVTLVTKMARQSKLLALNAAMEAARAGEQGQGFAVVASEVRRLAASSGDAAERTEALVKGILDRVAESRAASARAAATVDGVRGAVQAGLESFRAVEGAAREAEQWTGSIEHAATRSSALVGEMNGRLAALAQGTAVFASSMEEVAAASQEQSASTEEIAAAGGELRESAERLTGLVAAYRTETGTSTGRRR